MYEMRQKDYKKIEKIIFRKQSKKEKGLNES